MYYEPNAKIRIGTETKYLEFTSVNKIEIEKSVKELGGKATVTIPRNYKELDGKSILNLISPGDKVKIELGYDGNYYEEFTGYIREIESEAPLILHIDDEFYPLKRNELVKTFASGTTLEAILKYIAPGYTINCAEVKMSSFMLQNVSSYKALQAILEQYGFYTRLKGNELTCLWPYDMNGNKHVYRFYTPDVKKNSLKYKRKEEYKIRIKAISNQRNGTKYIEYYPPGANKGDYSIQTRNFGAYSKVELAVLAKKEYDRLCFNGYTGSITGFGTPRTQAGDILELIDSEEPDRQGQFMIDTVKITYDINTGYERENELSFKKYEP